MNFLFLKLNLKYVGFTEKDAGAHKEEDVSLFRNHTHVV